MKISELINETTLENQDLFIITDFATTESRSVQADHILQYVENNIDLNLTISDVIGLQGALDNKAPLNHTHPISQIVGLDARLTELEDFDNSTFITEAVGSTPASVTINGVTVSLDGSGGTGGFDPRFPSTGNNVGYYWRITGTNGTSTSVSPTDVKTDLGLDQVDNTSDLAKPISNVTQIALNGKANNADVFSGNYNDLTNRPITITGLQATEIAANTLKRSYPLADENKLATVEPNADVTDTANVYLALGANASTGRINYFLNERGQWVQIVGDGTSFDTTANYSVIGNWDFDGDVDLTDANVTLPGGLLPENPFNGFIQTNTPSSTNKFACWTASGQITWVPATGGTGGTTYSASLTATGPNDTVITYSPAQTVSGLGDGTTGSITATIAPAPGFEFVSTPVSTSFTFNYVINGANATQTHAFDPTTYDVQPITYRVTLNAVGPASTVITYNPSQTVTNISDGTSGTIVATIAPAPGFEFVTTPATTDYTLNYVINGADITASHVFDATTYQVQSDSTTFTATLGAASPPNTSVQFNPSAVVAGLLDGQSGSIVATVVAFPGYRISSGTTTYTFNYTINGANATDSVDFSNAPQNIIVEKNDLIAADFDETSLVVNGSGATLNVNIRGTIGTQFSLALSSVTPSGWITSGALGASSGVIPAGGEFETTVTIPAVTSTVDRTAAITATNSNDSTDTVTTGLFRQMHVQLMDGDLGASVDTVITGGNVTISGTTTAGDDFPVATRLFETDPSVAQTGSTDIPVNDTVEILNLGTGGAAAQTYWNTLGSTSGVTYAVGDTIQLSFAASPDEISTGTTNGTVGPKVEDSGTISANNVAFMFSPIDVSAFAAGDYTYFVRFRDDNGDVVTLNAEFTIAAPADNVVAEFFSNYYTKEGSSDLSSIDAFTQRIPAGDISSISVQVLDSGGVDTIANWNALTAGLTTFTNPPSYAFNFITQPGANAQDLLDTQLQVRITDTGESPNVVLGDAPFTFTFDAPAFAQIQVGQASNIAAGSSGGRLIASLNVFQDISNVPITSAGFDYLEADTDTIPPGSNTQSVTIPSTGDIQQLLSTNVPNINNGTTISVRAWVSNGTDTTYGAVHTYSYTHS